LIGKSSINRLAADVVPLFARPLLPSRSFLAFVGLEFRLQLSEDQHVRDLLGLGEREEIVEGSERGRSG